MTTLTLTIGGVDFMPQYVSGSPTITNQIQNQGDTMTFIVIQKSGQNAPQAGAEVIFKDGSRFLFGGFITQLTPVEFGIGSMIEWTVEATDYTYLIINKIAQATYINQTLAAIVTDLVTNSVDASYGLSLAGLGASTPTLSKIAFNHVSLRQAFEKLSKHTGYIWWIGYDKVIHFIDPASAASSPEDISDTTGNHESVIVKVDATQLTNDVTVIGGVQESANYTQIILADGQAREWFLLYPVTTQVSLQVNTGSGYVTKTVGIDPADDETLFDYMYSPTRGSIRASSGTTTPASSVLLKEIFTYSFPVVVELQDATSIIAMKAIEGGDGVHAYTITDTTILSQDQARARALVQLNNFGQPVVAVEVITRTGLLKAGTFFVAGNTMRAYLPSWGINSFYTYVIQKVVITMDESGSAIEYHYDITFGGRLIGVVDFLQALATPEEPIDDSGEVTVIHAISEIVTVAETLTRDLDRQSISESVTVAETIGQTQVTPPFKYAPSGTKKGQWNLAQWG